jgi:nicotinate-nucleotide pyrophosphorylase (carboxylating)
LELIPSIIRPIIEWGIREELLHGDHTSQLLDGHKQITTAQIYAKKPGVLCGIPVAVETFRLLSPDAEIVPLAQDGQWVQPGEVLLRITGPAWIFAAGERLALDYLQHLSGIATQARHYVELVKPYGTRISDARKGIPPIRVLQKYAVRIGGAFPHMYSLHNAILIKDNHIKMAGGIEPAVTQLRARGQHTLKIELEVETLEEVREALALGVECIMFDNMELDVLREAVSLVGDKAWTVATGGVDETTVVPIARTGVKQIAIGGIVHSVKVLDISLDIGNLKQSAVRDIALARAATTVPA